MVALKVETINNRTGSSCMKLTGFTEAELSELNSMDYREMKEKIIDMLDDRNNGLGTVWACGYGFWSAWIRDGAVYCDIGSSCD